MQKSDFSLTDSMEPLGDRDRRGIHTYSQAFLHRPPSVLMRKIGVRAGNQNEYFSLVQAGEGEYSCCGEVTKPHLDAFLRKKMPQATGGGAEIKTHCKDSLTAMERRGRIT